MRAGIISFQRTSIVFIVVSFQVIYLSVLARGETADILTEQNVYPYHYDCEKCNVAKGRDYYKSPNRVGIQPGGLDFNIITAYTDVPGAVRIGSVKSNDLSASWTWQDPSSGIGNKQNTFEVEEDSPQEELRAYQNRSMLSVDDNQIGGGIDYQQPPPLSPIKLKRKKLREVRRGVRTAAQIELDKEAEKEIEATAIERSKNLNTTAKEKYNIWKIEYDNPNSDSTLRLMRDQIIMAKAYGSIARSKKKMDIYNSLMKHIKNSRSAIGEAATDAELQPNALDRAKAMGHALSLSKDQLYDSIVMARKLRAMIQTSEDTVNALRKKSAFLIQLAAKSVPKSLHCLPLQLTTDYFIQNQDKNKKVIHAERLEDPSLHHYAIFSDNVIATSVVVNSTMLHAKEPKKHVFHIVTDRLNFPAMKMWFIVNPPASAAIQVQNIDDFKWLNSSYCSVLRQLESTRLKEYYFKANHPSSLSAGSDNLKYRNPKYLSMLNHLRFYLPEVYPKLDKILFLDDDIVVQKDLTPLWSVDLQGMVNGAVETCKGNFHRFDKYLNFSNPEIYQHFDPNACGWAFGMNLFDLREWKKQDITGIYHHWQDLNEDRTLWKLGSLPPGLITFYNLTYPLDRGWHVLGLGYDPALNQTEIENAAVVHYNGNYKPWLDLAIAKYKKYWTRYVMFDNSYFAQCNIGT